jgi:2'-5' RNA ligase superfamily protein
MKTMKPEQVYISITLIPPKEICQEVVNLNHMLAQKYSVRPIQGNPEWYAHISLYNADFPYSKIEEIKNILAHLAKELPPIILVPEQISTKGRYVSVNFIKNEALKNIHEQIVGKLNPLREGLVKSKYIEKREFYTEQELSNAREYGYSFSMDLFIPHMTVAAMENLEDVPSVAQEVVWDKSFTSTKISMRVAFKNDEDMRVTEDTFFDLGG